MNVDKKRKPLSARLRYRIFRRDGFTCQYCGKTADDKILEIDHIIPYSRGGTNDMDNLITSCRDCNRGKTNITVNTDVQNVCTVKLRRTSRLNMLKTIL